MIFNGSPKAITGFYLLEALIAFVILAFGMAAFVKLQANLMQYSRTAKLQADALVVAKNKIEELRNFQVIVTQAGFKAYEDIVSNAAGVVEEVNGIPYKVVWLVATDTNVGYKTIDVIVSWSEVDTVRSVKLSTIVAKIDPVSIGFL